MTRFLVHFVIGLAGGLAIFALFMWLSPARSTSAPFGLIFLALACASLAVFASPWWTPAVLALYAAASLREHRQDRAASRGS